MRARPRAAEAGEGGEGTMPTTRRRATIAAAAAILLAGGGLAGCAAGGGGPSAGAAADSSEGPSRTVPSLDGSFEGEIVGGDPAPSSKFAKVRIGMRAAQVAKLIGEPDDTDSHITGKAFIPFFFGGDTRRVEHFYAREGILTFSPAHFMGEPDTLIRIIVDPAEKGVAH